MSELIEKILEESKIIKRKKLDSKTIERLKKEKNNKNGINNIEFNVNMSINNLMKSSCIDHLNYLKAEEIINQTYNSDGYIEKELLILTPEKLKLILKDLKQ